MSPSHSTTVVLLAQGDELTAGQTVDTNSAWLAKELSLLGYTMAGIEICPDDPAIICEALKRANQRAGLVISTGGLGPTEDDYTAEGAAAWAGHALALHQPSLERIQKIWTRRNRTMPQSNRKQAMIPADAQVLENNWGTAPGFVLEHANTTAYFLPGVPREMKQFWRHHLRSALLKNNPMPPKHRAVLRCIGISESQLQDRINELTLLPDLQVHYKTKLPENRVILDAPREMDEVAFNTSAHRIAEQIGRSCLGVNTPSLPELISQTLRERSETIATAESCTGGRISASLTALPGASDIFLEGVCVYSNAAKIRNCDVRPETIAASGAVSKGVALELAQGIRSRASSTYGLGVTGIAGPSGGSEQKPIGTVHLALATPQETIHHPLTLGNMGRERIITVSASLALDLLRRHLQNPSLQHPVKF